MRRVWRDMERVAAGRRAKLGTARVAVKEGRLIRDLEELIAALDRRLPGVEQAGEVAIAQDAAALRAKAIARLAELADAELLKTRH